MLRDCQISPITLLDILAEKVFRVLYDLRIGYETCATISFFFFNLKLKMVDVADLVPRIATVIASLQILNLLVSSPDLGHKKLRLSRTSGEKPLEKSGMS